MRARLVHLVGLGVPYSHAARACGISTQTFITWRNEYDDFRGEIEQAVAAAIEKRLKIIEDAAEKGDARAAMWMLERLHPQHFARNRIEVTGADGAPLTGAIALYLPQKDGGQVVTLDTAKEIQNGNGE